MRHFYFTVELTRQDCQRRLELGIAAGTLKDAYRILHDELATMPEFKLRSIYLHKGTRYAI